MALSISEIIQTNPIGNHLDAFRPDISLSLDTIKDEDRKELTADLLEGLTFKTSKLLPSKAHRKSLYHDILQLLIAIDSDDFDFDRTNPLLKTILTNKPDQEIWHQVYNAVTESTPPLRSIASSLQQTPNFHNTRGMVSTSERRTDVDPLLKHELDAIYIDVPEFYDRFFGGVAQLETTSGDFFEKCKKGRNPSFRKGWVGWPSEAVEADVLEWLTKFTKVLATFARKHRPTRRTIAEPNKPIESSTSVRKLDIGFVKNGKKGKKSHWSEILVPGELKSNPYNDRREATWNDIARYAREVFAAQDTRRFVLGFTLCGSLMRIWEFDRLGGIASESFDINKEGLRFVSTILGFLWMDEEELGFDPTIQTANNQRFICIERENGSERLVIDKLMMRSRGVVTRATTCWKAHSENDPSRPLVIKDSWQFMERDEEGEMLLKATKKNVVNVSRYYHHETVQIRDKDDDVNTNIRKGLDITQASNYPPKRSIASQDTGSIDPLGKTGKKRSSSQTNTLMPPPPSKRSRQTSSSVAPTEPHNAKSSSRKPSGSASSVKIDTRLPPNRIHRRVILGDYGKPIYTASSHEALLTALAGCITGLESLHKAGFLHRDISINNLIINEDKKNPSLNSFIIDLDLTIPENRVGSSGAKGRTGTRAFMAIGVHWAEQHSFMHDLESFFWVTFWICIHYNGPGNSIHSRFFERWNYEPDDYLRRAKLGMIADEQMFMREANEHFTPYYQPLIRRVNKLRKVVFPNNQTWKKTDPKLYSKMREILLKEFRTCDIIHRI